MLNFKLFQISTPKVERIMYNDIEAIIKVKFEALNPMLDERSQRLWAAAEAKALGKDGILIVSRATGLSRKAIHQGLRELDKLKKSDEQRECSMIESLESQGKTNTDSIPENVKEGERQDDTGKMTIKELEKKSGFRRSTIHLYIRTGLLHEPYRTTQTMAYYDENHLRRLKRIQKIKNDFLKNAATSRVPLDFIKNQIEEDKDTNPNHNHHALSQKTEKKNDEKKIKKKEEIIQVALRLYAEKGYHRTNIKDITKKVGISAPTFYHYFQSKKELFSEVIDYVINEWKEESRIALHGEPNRVVRSVMLFRIFQKHYPRIGEVLNNLRAAVVIGDQWAKDKLASAYRDLMENLVMGVRSYIEKGLFRKVDPELLSYFLFIIDEAAVQKASIDDNYTIEELMSFIADMIAYGFMTEEGRENFNQLRKDVSWNNTLL